MTAKRELYENVVAEVRESNLNNDHTLVNYTDVIEGEATRLPIDAEEPYSGNLEAFADYTVRDAVLIKATEDEFFSYVLVSKIVKACLVADEDNNLTQNHLEALATVAHISTMWEQEQAACMLVNKVIPDYADRYDLDEPSLNGYSRRILGYENFPYSRCRADLVRDLKEKSLSALDEEVSAE